ncbi:hypothetical protein M409DRAFT_35172 [Zasmidium cellare ATCC 36951]|uniref:Epoxide hydrolase N-terminal domain-containing protein n=1 Tax=Zasmidium cellare ATCC 36951 TaxID=1080233 RepID=A0A6A6D2D0_ZASCE|nr:uncharacterized protein M409DRAFT_35172 [Zasmidium cellare ATCC 36951]KAF2173531.1 hypothetical protein M409DRAFT_35172 [Zasmidium cellare ATCC 36951]
MADYGKLPANATLKPQPFTARVSEEKLKLMKDLIRLSPIGPEVFENRGTDRSHGMRRDWLATAQKTWLNDFDWRKTEDWINSFPNFTVKLQDSARNEIDLHFAALFSQREDAIPISMAHGWPGSFLEGLKVLEILRERYSPQELPFHFVVPSLPGYAFSSGPPLDGDYSVPLASELFDSLMRVLGFSSGYIAQGGDVGTGIVIGQAAGSDSCKGFHLNNVFGDPPAGEGDPEEGLDEVEKRGLRRGEEFLRTGMAYAMEHGTRPGTIGLVLQSSPLAGLAWIGEKYLEWTDEDPSVETILQVASLYWLTDTYPRCIYPYRALVSGWKRGPYIDKPFGYSFFPMDVLPKPGAWAKQEGNLVHYVRHDSGGHFPGLEKPVELLADLEAFVKKAWEMKK